MKTEAVTLTQEASTTYARGGVIFMAQEAAVETIADELVVQQERAQEKRAQQDLETQERQQEAERARTERVTERKVGEAIAKLEAKIPITKLLTDANDLSKTLHEHLSQEEIRSFIKEIADAIEDPTLRTTREGRILRREYRELQERLVAEMPKAVEEALGAPTAFNEQLINQFGDFLGGNIRIIYDESTEVVSDPSSTNGVVTVHMPKNPSIEQLIALVREVDPGRLADAAQGNMLQFAQDLQAAARMLEQQGMSVEAVTTLYNTGATLERMLTNSSEPPKLEYGQIQKMKDKIPQDIQDRVFFNLVMGRHVLTSEPERGKLYDVQFERWQRHQKEGFREKPIHERQQEYDAYLRNSNTQASILHMVTKFIDRSITKQGGLARLKAHAGESKLGQDMLQGMVAKWQQDIAETEGGRKLFDRAQEIATGSTQDRLERVNRLFQPGQKAELLQYVPSDIKNLLATGEDFSRTEAACAIATAYEKHVLEQMGFTVYTDLSGAHSTLLVVEGNSAYRIDPNTIYDENRSINLLSVVKIGDNEFGQLQSRLQQLSSNPNGTIRIKDAKGNLHVIGGDNLVTSEYIGNLAALRVHKNGKFRKGYLEAMLPNASPEELQELRFALAQKAVDIAPDNYVAWAQMGKFATDGRNKEYHEYALALNKKGVEEAESKDLLVGAKTLESIKVDRLNRQGIEVFDSAGALVPPAETYGEHYGVGEKISDAMRFFESSFGMPPDRGRDSINTAIIVIENLISRDVDHHNDGRYVVIINNIISAIEEKIEAAPADQKEHWRHLAHVTFDYSYERLIGGNDDTPKLGWRQPQGLYTPQSIENIKDMASVFDRDQEGKTKDSTYLSVLLEQRQNAHTVFQHLNNKELFKNAAKSLGETGLTFIEEEIPGVAEVQQVYEKVYNNQPANYDKWSDTNTFKEYADRIVRGEPKTTDPNSDLGLIGTMGMVDQKSGFKLRPWQIIRAGTVGMQMSAMAQRRMVFGVLGDAPSVNDIPAIVASMAGEGNITGLGGALKLTVARYFFEPNAREFVKGVVKAQREKGSRGRQFGLIMGGDLILNKADATEVAPGSLPKWKGLWGQSEVSYVLLDAIGSQDPKSMKWAAEYMYLDRNDYRHYTISETDFHGVSNEFLQSFRQKFGSQVIDRNGSPKQLTLKEYLDMQKLIAQEQVGGKDFDSPGVKEQFNTNIQRIVRSQRLFLGALLHYNYSVVGDNPLTDQTKAIIWDTVADLMPSKFAAYLPKEAKNIMAQQVFGRVAYTKNGEENIGVGPGQLTALQFEQLKAGWEEMLKKLWIAEQARVREDSIIFSTEPGITYDEKVRRLGWNPPNAPLGWNPGDPLPQNIPLEYYLDSAQVTNPAPPPATLPAFSAQERAVIRGVRDLGKMYVAQNADGTPVAGWQNNTRQGTEFAGGFARMNFIFTPFLDDAPSTKWSRLPETTVQRVLVGTQDDLDGANDILTGFVADPIKKPADVIEPLKNALVKLSSPHGIYDSQTVLMGWVESYLELATETWGGKHFGIVMKLFRRGRSKLEKHNLQANIALAETETAEFLGALAQNQIINDDPSHKLTTGRTMYKELRKKYKADILHVALGFLRIFTMLFGTALALELLKAFLPEEVGKQLG